MHAQEQVEFDHNHKSQQLLNAATSGIVPFDEYSAVPELLPAIGNLTALTTLVLEIMHISGTIPDSLGSLTALTGLGLDQTTLSGTIPDSLGLLAS